MNYKYLIICMLCMFIVKQNHGNNNLDIQRIKCKIFSNKYNILYQGLNNIIKIEVDSGFSYDSLSVKTEFGIINGDNGIFRLDFPDVNEFSYLDIVIIYNKNTIIGKRTFMVRRKNEIFPILSNNSDLFISKKIILKDPFIRIIRNDSIINNMQITSFCFSANCDMGKNDFQFKRFFVNGNKLDKSALSLLGFCVPSQFIYIENIKYKDNKGVVKDLQPIIHQLNGSELIEGYFDDYPSDSFINCEIIKYLPR